jgi:hypothetical protein
MRFLAVSHLLALASPRAESRIALALSSPLAEPMIVLAEPRLATSDREELASVDAVDNGLTLDWRLD